MSGKSGAMNLKRKLDMKSQKMPWVLSGLILAVVGATFWVGREPDATTAPTAATATDVRVPAQFSEAAARGGTAFDSTCAACHGVNGAGTDAGPPLIHRIYEPSHHGDYAFQLAVSNGVRAHHWRFGNMPPQPGLSEAEVSDIIAYVREVQRENGIE